MVNFELRRIRRFREAAESEPESESESPIAVC